MGLIYRELFSPVPSMLSLADNCGRYGIPIIGYSFSEISLLQIGIALENITRTRVAADARHPRRLLVKDSVPVGYTCKAKLCRHAFLEALSSP